MLKLIPEELYKNKGNKGKVHHILKTVPDTSLRMDDIKTLDDAIAEIEQLGETKVAKFLAG